MTSITDCVTEGLKYPLRDIKKLLVFGVLFALTGLIHVFMSVKSVDIFKSTVTEIEKTNSTATHLSLAQLPMNDIYLVAGLAIVSFIILLFILGYQYNILKFSIEKKEDIPGFDNILEMLINGIKYILVAAVYNIVPFIIFVCGIKLAGDSSWVIAVGLVSVLLFIIAYFFLIMAINNMVANDSIKKAFDLREITGNISNLGWGKYIGTIIFTLIIYVIIMFAASFILGIITAIFTVISIPALVISIIIAVIEGLIINSYCAIFYNRVCGAIYRESIKQ